MKRLSTGSHLGWEGPCGMCCPGPSAPSPDPASLKQRQCPRQHHPAHAVLQARPEGHQDVVPDGMIAELECHPHLAAVAVPIQVVKDLLDVFVESRAKAPLALDESPDLTSMRLRCFCGALCLCSG